MSSPCKRLKLTPKKNRIEDIRLSQESKVTSTPQSSIRKLPSPSLSRISSSASSRSIRTRLSDAFTSDNGVSCSDNEQNETESISNTSKTDASQSEKSLVISPDYDTYFEDLGRIKYAGNVWKTYKPLHDGTLYSRICEDPQDAQETVTELLLLYSNKPDVAVSNLIQFCVDVSGYQNFNVSDHYNFREDVATDIIKMMESEDVLNRQETLAKSGKYLFMEPKTQLAKILKTSIYNFLQKLILCAHDREILYDDVFSKQFFTFIKAMSSSNIRAIRHTAVIFAIKILTTLVIVYNKVINEGIYSEEENGVAEQDVLNVRKQDINALLEFFYFIFVKNCRLQDNKVTLMRVECIQEVSIWIKYFPKIFITQLQAINYLHKLITDMSKDVRYAALETFEALVKTPNILAILKVTLSDFSETIGKRFYDVDTKVSVKAIDIFTVFVKQDNSLISPRRFKLLINLVFDKCYPIGEAAAKFLLHYLQINEENEHMILVQLAKFSIKRGYGNKQLLVEGCLHNCSVIQEWDIYIDILSNYEDFEVKQSLVQIFSESVCQTLEGKSSITREMAPKAANVDASEHVKIAKCFPRINKLLKKYKNHSMILIELLKIITSVSKDINENYCQHYMDICDTIEVLFYEHEDESLLAEIGKTFHYFCNVTHFSKRAKKVTERICSRYGSNFLESSPVMEHAEIILKVRILFTHFNFTKYLSWAAIFENMGDEEFIRDNLLCCCKWYLIWSLRDLIDIARPSNTELQKEFPQLSRTCKEYVGTCFRMLDSLNGQPLHIKVYNLLCHLHITYMEDLEGPIKLFKQFEELKLTINDGQLQNSLVSFLDKHVISNTEMSLHDRRAHVVQFVNLVHHNILPTQCLAYVFKYYYAYNKEFGPIIESSLMSMAAAPDENVILMMVVYTLSVIYENVITKRGAIDLRTEDANNIKLLLKQFLAFKVFRSSNGKFQKLLYFSFNYAFKDESKYSFLYFVKYFIDLLDDEDKREVLEFFKKKIPSGAAKNDAVLFVGNYLKQMKPSATAQKTKEPIIKQKSASKRLEKENKVPTPKPAKSKGTKQQKTSKIKNTRSTVQKSKQPESAKLPKEKSISRAKQQKELNAVSETEMSEDDLTIHDSESDDLEESLTGLRI